MSADATPLVAAVNLEVYFPTRSGLLPTRRHWIRAVDDVSLEIRRGEALGLVGESGCGKSTFGRALIRLRRPTSGIVRFDGVDLGSLSNRELRKIRRRIQMIFQDPYGSLNPRMTVASILKEPLAIHQLAKGPAQAERVTELLELVGLSPEHQSRYPSDFSGGQRQRIGIARALAVEPEFIVCDEPISALDVSIQAQVLNLLVDLRARLGLTYLFIAHDLAAVRHVSDRVGVMYLGRIVELGPTRKIYTRPGHPYTQALLSAVPIADPKTERARKRIILAGEIPSAADPPNGCRFHTRCWLYQRLGKPDICRLEEPALGPNGADHRAACHFSAHLQGERIGAG